MNSTNHTLEALNAILEWMRPVMGTVCEQLDAQDGRLLDMSDAYEKVKALAKLQTGGEKEWSLPPLPEGLAYHRVDGWTEEMLPEGWRPLLRGEQAEWSDQCKDGDAVIAKGEWTECGTPRSDMRHATWIDNWHVRTRRPLPPSPERPAEAPPEKWAAEKAAHAQGKRIQLRSRGITTTEWGNWMSHPHPEFNDSSLLQYRIHPDDQPSPPAQEAKKSSDAFDANANELLRTGNFDPVDSSYYTFAQFSGFAKLMWERAIAWDRSQRESRRLPSVEELLSIYVDVTSLGPSDTNTKGISAVRQAMLDALSPLPQPKAQEAWKPKVGDRVIFVVDEKQVGVSGVVARIQENDEHPYCVKWNGNSREVRYPLSSLRPLPTPAQEPERVAWRDWWTLQVSLGIDINLHDITRAAWLAATKHARGEGEK